MVNPSLPSGMSRPLLSFLFLTFQNIQVTKILLKSKTNSPPYTASGITFAPTNSSSGPFYTAFARKEVILAAGAIGTPHLLQLSGIGDKNVLEPLGVDTKIDLKTVGKNFQEQVCLPVPPFLFIRFLL